MKRANQIHPYVWAAIMTFMGISTHFISEMWRSSFEWLETVSLVLLGTPYFLLSVGVSSVEYALLDYFENEILVYGGGAIMMFSIAYICALPSRKWYIRLLLTYGLMWAMGYVCGTLAFFTIWSNL